MASFFVRVAIIDAMLEIVEDNNLCRAYLLLFTKVLFINDVGRNFPDLILILNH